jgi:hypothetical protein
MRIDEASPRDLLEKPAKLVLSDPRDAREHFHAEILLEMRFDVFVQLLHLRDAQAGGSFSANGWLRAFIIWDAGASPSP